MAIMQIAFLKCHGSGNDFPLIDARMLALGETEWATLARLLADRNGPVGGDGLLALTAGDADHQFGMRMWNSDGSEAETCLNGLRCTARLGFEVLGLNAARVRLKKSAAEVALADPIAPGVVTIRTRVGPASLQPSDVGLRGTNDPVIEARVAGLPSARRFTAVAMPNPHLVTFVEEVDEVELIAVGDWCEARPALLADRANVSFVQMRGGDLYVRTYERGVGLTDSCGSAMAASTFAAGLTGRVAFGARVRVFNRGGLVLASATAPDQGAQVTIEGNATFLYDASIEVDLTTGTTAMPLIHNRRENEAAAWQAAVSALARIP